MFLMFCALTAYYAGLSWLLSQPWLNMPAEMNTVLVASIAVQILFLMLAMLGLASEKPVSRLGWHLYTLAQAIFTGWLAYQGVMQPDGKLVWWIWGICSLIKVWGLFSYGSWLQSSYWPRIFFDKTLRVYQQEDSTSYRQPQVQPAASVQPTAAPRSRVFPAPSRKNPSVQSEGPYLQDLNGQPVDQSAGRPYQPEMSYQQVVKTYGTPEVQNPQPAPQFRQQPQPVYQQPVYEEDEYEMLQEDPVLEKTVFSYPQLAIHIAVCVYSELILLPILCEFLHPWLVTTDKNYSFATQVMFSLCIISAIVWTIAVFFLYLRQPSSRAVVGICMGVEAMTAVWTVLKLYSYTQSIDVIYSWYVYAIFAVLDLVRLGILLWAASPVFKVPVPKPDEYDSSFSFPFGKDSDEDEE